MRSTKQVILCFSLFTITLLGCKPRKEKSEMLSSSEKRTPEKSYSCKSQDNKLTFLVFKPEKISDPLYPEKMIDGPEIVITSGGIKRSKNVYFPGNDPEWFDTLIKNWTVHKATMLSKMGGVALFKQERAFQAFRKFSYNGGTQYWSDRVLGGGGFVDVFHTLVIESSTEDSMVVTVSGENRVSGAYYGDSNFKLFKGPETYNCVQDK
jgi:hypothetical protein